MEEHWHVTWGTEEMLSCYRSDIQNNSMETARARDTLEFEHASMCVQNVSHGVEPQLSLTHLVARSLTLP